VWCGRDCIFITVLLLLEVRCCVVWWVFVACALDTFLQLCSMMLLLFVVVGGALLCGDGWHWW